MTLPIGVLVSGSGSNLQSLIDRIEDGALDAEIKLVFSNKEGAFGLERAKRHGIPTASLSHKNFESREDFDAAMVGLLRAAGAEAVVMAGFMRIVTSTFLDAFPGKVLNIHPALLPSFPGAHAQADASGYGVRLSGCTVHFVDEKTDHGPIVIQAAVPARPGEGGDELGARILKLEHRILPQAVHWLATGRLSVEGRDGRLVHVAGPDVPQADCRGEFLVSPPLEKGF